MKLNDPVVVAVRTSDEDAGLKSEPQDAARFCGSGFIPTACRDQSRNCRSEVRPTLKAFGLLLGLLLGLSPMSVAAADEAGQETLRFAITRYAVEGATLLTAAEIEAAVAPFVGTDKDFSDVQSALEAIEELYAQRGYSAVHVLLPEQELEAGAVRFEVIEGHYGKVEVKNNRFFSEANVLNAIPSVKSGGVPQARQVARELRLANENPARRIDVVLKGGAQDDEVDAGVQVSDSKFSQWTLTADNSGTVETGRSRIGLSYRHANLFDLDHVAQIQAQISPEHTDRSQVIGGSYRMPLYEAGHSIEFFGSYSNINAVVGGLSNFQGGGLMFSTRYNIPLERRGTFDPRVSFGLDWRRFDKIELTSPPPTTLFGEIVVTPLSAAYTTQGRLGRGDLALNTSLTVNVPVAGSGKSADFATYDRINTASPESHYKVLRFGASYFLPFAADWQWRTAFSGQWSSDRLIQGEQIRLGGADGVRGFSEGSETGERGGKLNLELYAPAWNKGGAAVRGLVFADAGRVQPKSANSVNVASLGLGLRASYSDALALRFDAGRIMNEGTDPKQQQGDWRLHASLAGTF